MHFMEASVDIGERGEKRTGRSYAAAHKGRSKIGRELAWDKTCDSACL